MSDRMMSLAAGLGHNQEVYSIDESFVDLSGISCFLHRHVHHLAHPRHAPKQTHGRALRAT
jgi:DNA polymerase V